MRNVIWLFLLFVAAVAAALFLGNNRATVTLFWHPYRVDMSLNLLLLALLLLLGLIWLAVRTFASLRKIRLNAALWRQQQQERALQQALLAAMQQFADTEHANAQNLAEQTIIQMQRALETAGHAPESQDHSFIALTESALGLAHWIAAESAHALGDHAAGDAHYQAYLERRFKAATGENNAADAPATAPEPAQSPA